MSVVHILLIHCHLIQLTIALAADPLLEWNYGVFAVMSAIAGVLFWFSVRKLDTHEDELNNMDEGHITTMSEGHITNEKPSI